MKFTKHKGNVNELSGYALLFVVSAIIIAFGAMVLANVQTAIGVSAGNTSAAYTTAGYGLSGLQTFGQWLPIIAIVLVAGVVIGIILYSFSGKSGGTSGA